MGDTTTTVLIAALGPAGLLAGQWISGRRDDRRWERERSLERERWRREDESRWSVDRRDAYLQFVTRIDELRQRTIDVHADPELSYDDMLGELQRAWAAVSAVALWGSPDVCEKADTLWSYVMKRDGDELGLVHSAAKHVATITDANDQVLRYADDVLRAMRDDLGIKNPHPV